MQYTPAYLLAELHINITYSLFHKTFSVNKQPKRLTHRTDWLKECVCYVYWRRLWPVTMLMMVLRMLTCMFWYSCFTAFPSNNTKLCWCYWCIVKKLITDSLTHSRKLKIFWFTIHNSVVTRAILRGSNIHQISGWVFVPALPQTP